MTSRQRELCLEIVRQRSHHPNAARSLLEQPWTSGNLTARVLPYVRVAERRGDATTYRAELPAENPGRQTPPAAVRDPAGHSRSTRPGATPTRAPEPGPVPPPPPDAVARHPVTQLIFTLRSRTDRSVIVALTTTPP